jgi:acyl-CoA thioester hydrolase
MKLEPSEFPVIRPAHLRWADVDMFGHVNNAVYYGIFDTAINAWIANHTGVDPVSAPHVNVVAESACRYLAEIRLGDRIDVAVGVRAIGTSSVTYTLGLFANRAEAATLCAFGHWVHVYVERHSQQPIVIPPSVRALAETAVMRKARPFTLRGIVSAGSS